MSSPSYTSDKLQPCNISVFALLKARYRKQVDRLERGGVNTIGKEYFTSLYSPVRETAFTPKKIKARFATSSLFPLNLDRVLRSMLTPPAKGRALSVRRRTINTCNASISGGSYVAVTPDYLIGCLCA